jgi:hypothetical protein
MALASTTLQALIKVTAALNCDDPFPLESVPLTLPQIASFRLLGRLISPSPPSVLTVCDFLLHAWKFATPFTVDLLPGDRLLFTVTFGDLVGKIMNNGPWNVKGALIVVKPWTPEQTIEEVDLSTCAFWVQVQGLPLQNLIAVNDIKIGKFIGIDVLNVENGDKEGIIAHHHLHIRILINVLQPLVLGFFLPSQDLPSIWIKFKFERLADYCGLIGHRKYFCPGLIQPYQQELFVYTLRGYVYTGTKFAPSQPAQTPAMFSTSSLLCTEDLGTLFQTHLEASHRGKRSHSFLLEPPPAKHGATRPASSPHVESVLHGPPLAMSHQPEQDRCPKGK